MSEPEFWLTNDDGIDAPGLAALAGAVTGLGRIVQFAPSGPRSGCGHAVTTDQAITVQSFPDLRFAVSGTPADCIRIGLAHRKRKPELVVSGINAGANLGVDAYHSGTIAAAREAAIHGIPAIAISHYIRRGLAIDWQRASATARRVIDLLLPRMPEPPGFWNVNLPHLDPNSPEPPIVFCPLDPSPHPNEYRWAEQTAYYIGTYADRQRRPGHDVEACFGGSIAITCLEFRG